MIQAGPNNAIVATGLPGGEAGWSNVINASGISDNIFASVIGLPTALGTNHLSCQNYNFNIPNGATILGIMAGVWQKASIDIATISIALQKDNATRSITTINRITTNSNTKINFGDNTNLWGTSWTPAEINNSTFGLQVEFVNDLSETGQPTDVYVDAAEITIYYTVDLISLNSMSVLHQLHILDIMDK